MKRLRRFITSSFVVYVGAGALMLWITSGVEGLTRPQGFGIGISLAVAFFAGGMHIGNIYETKLNRQARQIKSLERELEYWSRWSTVTGTDRA